MCLIIVKKKNIHLPLEEHIRNGAKSNPHGIGIALWKSTKNEVYIKKNFKDVDELLKWQIENVNISDAYMIHFRFATSGLVDEGNRHPFPITKNWELLRKEELYCQQAVMHNGVISKYGSHKTYSDTQKFVVDILSDETIKSNINNPTVHKLIEGFLSGDRLSIMDNNGEIILLNDWEEEDSMMFSNAGYKTNRWVALYQPITRYNHRTYCDDKEDDNFDDGRFEVCEGCGLKKFVRFTEVKKEGCSSYIELCKKCRKDLRKGKLETLKAVDDDIVMCDSCREWTDKKDITQSGLYCFCKDCAKIEASLHNN